MGDRFLQLLETKLELDQQSATALNNPATSASTVPLLYPQSELALDRSAVAANHIRAPGRADSSHHYTVPMPTHSPATSVPLHFIDQRAVETALHDYTRTKIPPDLVAPPVPSRFGFSDRHPMLWDSHRRSLEAQSEIQTSGQQAHPTATMQTGSPIFGASTRVQPNSTVAHHAPTSHGLQGPYPVMQPSHIAPHPTLPQHDAAFRPAHHISDVSSTLGYTFNGPPGSESRIAALSVPNSPAHWSAAADRGGQHQQVPAGSPVILTVSEPSTTAKTLSIPPIQGAESRLSPPPSAVGRPQQQSQRTSMLGAPVGVKTRLSALSPVVKALGVGDHGTTSLASSHPGMQLGSSSALQPSAVQLVSYSPSHVFQRDLSSPRSLPMGWTFDKVSSAAASPRPASLTVSPRPNTSSAVQKPSPAAKKRKLPRSENDPCAEERSARMADPLPNKAKSTGSETETTKAEEKKPIIACHLCRSKKLKCVPYTYNLGNALMPDVTVHDRSVPRVCAKARRLVSTIKSCAVADRVNTTRKIKERSEGPKQMRGCLVDPTRLRRRPHPTLGRG